MSAEIIKLVILHLSLWTSPTKLADADRYAFYINYYSQEFDVDPAITTAVIYRESNFDQYMVGKAKEIGLGQIKKGTPSTRDYNDLPRRAFFEPSFNIFLVVRNLARVRAYCHSDNPNQWLSAYNGWRRRSDGHCFKTNYSKRVMSTYRLIKKLEVQYGTAEASN